MEKKLDNKKRETIIIFIVLSIVFLVYLIPGVVPEIYEMIAEKRREEQIVKYLENEYDLEVEVNEFQGVTYAKISGTGMSCDGVEMFKKSDKEQKYYYYTMYSKVDNKYFEAYIYDNKGKIYFDDNYEYVKYIDSLTDEIIIDIKYILGTENIEIDVIPEKYKYNLFFDAEIHVNVNQNLDDIIDVNYVEQIYEIKENMDAITYRLKLRNQKISILFTYTDNKKIETYEYGVYENSHTSIKLDRYLDQLNE